MRCHTIYLDLDDTLNTLAAYILYRKGLQSSPTCYRQLNHDTNFVRQLNRIAKSRDLGFTFCEDFWETVPRRDWAKVPWSEDGMWLYHEARRLVGDDNVFIVTRPTLTPDCLAGKMDWILHNIPSRLRGNVHITPHKHHLAGVPGVVLIDDCEENCQKFERCGGAAIRFPRPWNQARWREAREFISGELARFREP